jgi:hypothetical protein
MSDIINTFWEGLTDWPVGTIIGGILLLLMLALAGIIVWLIVAGVYHLTDYTGMPEHSRAGTISDKSFRQAYTEYIYVYNAATKTSMPTPVFHPARWTLQVDIGIGTDSIDVSSSFYAKVTVGTSVTARYKVGRISHRINVTAVGLR